MRKESAGRRAGKGSADGTRHDWLKGTRLGVNKNLL